MGGVEAPGTELANAALCRLLDRLQCDRVCEDDCRGRRLLVFGRHIPTHPLQCAAFWEPQLAEFEGPEAPGPWQESLPDRATQALRFALLDKGGVGKQRQPFLPWLSFSRVKVHPVIKLKLSADDTVKILVVALGDPESWLPIPREAWRDLGDSNGDLSLSVSSSFSCP